MAVVAWLRDKYCALRFCSDEFYVFCVSHYFRSRYNLDPELLLGLQTMFERLTGLIWGIFCHLEMLRMAIVLEG